MLRRPLWILLATLSFVAPTLYAQEAEPNAEDAELEGSLPGADSKPPAAGEEADTAAEPKLTVMVEQKTDPEAEEESARKGGFRQNPVLKNQPDLLPVPEDVAAPPESAEVRESGLASRVLEPGDGESRPNLASRVRVHFAGWTTDGEQIENTYPRETPPFLQVKDVIDGWREGLQLMVEGEKRRFWVPGELAFEGSATLPQGMIVFDIELLEIVNPPSTPEHLTAPPPEAEIHNKKGLASVLLKEGHDVLRPRAESYVTVHYTGWTTDGTLIDSSVLRGAPSSFQLLQVIKGWREGVQLMVAGEKRRFWVPEKLAYKGDKTKPQGMLIFDIELIAIPRY